MSQNEKPQYDRLDEAILASSSITRVGPNGERFVQMPFADIASGFGIPPKAVRKRFKELTLQGRILPGLTPRRKLIP